MTTGLLERWAKEDAKNPPAWSYQDYDFVKGPIEQPHPNVFVFDLLTPLMCKSLLLRIANAPSEAPNSMNKYGVDLHGLGLDKWLHAVMLRHVLPIAQDYYPEVGKLAKPYGFIVKYAIGKQRKLDAHIDEPSAVTLNVCLGEEFEDGELVFLGPRKERFEVEHKVGRAIVHRGHHLHQAKSITSGSRTNLILWCGEKR